MIIFILICLIIVIGVYAIFVRDLMRARARLTGCSKMIETSFGALEYAVVGEGEPLLVVHGAAGGFDQSIDMAGAVVGRGYSVIAPSRFGYLRSALPDDPTTAMQADAYVQLLDHLGIDKVAIVSISAGAWSALQFGARHPERCRMLALLVPADYLPAGTSIRGGAIARVIFNSDFVAWAALKLTLIVPGGVAQTILGTDASVIRAAEPSEKARVRQVLEHLLPVSSRFRGMQFDIQTAAMHEPYPIENTVCPVLTISAEDDRFGTAARARHIAKSVLNGKTVIFPTGGHALVGRNADALREVVSFLQHRVGWAERSEAQPTK